MSRTGNVDRRTTLKLLGMGGAGLAAPYIIRSQPAWAASGVLNITTYDKFLPQEFIDKFQKDTGIEVRIRLTDDQGKQYNLLTAEGANPSTDIVTVAGHRYSQYIGSKLVQPLDTGKLSNWNNLNKAYQDAPWARIDGNLWGLPILAGYEGLVRNVDYVKEAPSWEVMFDPQYKGLTSYIISDFLQIVMLYQGNDGDFVSYADKPDVAQKATNEARDFLIKNKDMVRKYYDAGSEVQQMFINEDIYLAHSWSGPAAKLIMDGHPIQLSVPKEGTYGFCYTLNVVNNAPNAENAYKLFDAILASPEVGAAMTRQSGFSSTMNGVGDLLSERERLASTLPQDEIERIIFFSTFNRDMKNEMIDRATAEVKAA
ncbi:extracellular solute-binding protein [Aquamicrobium defluvii]|uniref:Spermidine/putrescine ABC transporter substrate-binding protein n=1 Tax=Aquamicrobium defluvii TaxID=69279 RepID=A0A011V0P2_9HYPH|nr:extracellular solute-binding protein [Aquamicrobium defluvii]EXL01990.1 spermidine/putrescine ABC transporter substrate-binding protein [Aquamicrobium defluvii]EZQ13546.1 spermidine/putrescine ABC transporter substrate-binding protein [Halopseudomonas bauzanensis]